MDPLTRHARHAFPDTHPNEDLQLALARHIHAQFTDAAPPDGYPLHDRVVSSLTDRQAVELLADRLKALHPRFTGDPTADGGLTIHNDQVLQRGPFQALFGFHPDGRLSWAKTR